MHRREGVRKSQKGWNGRLQSVQEFITGDMEGVGYSINPILCKWPVACIDAVSDGREDWGIIASPEFRPEDNVTELSAIGDLQSSC